MAVISKSFSGYDFQNLMLEGGIVTLTTIGAGTTTLFPPYYASLTWGSASTGSISITNTPVINVSSGVNIKYITLSNGTTTRIIFGIDEEIFAYSGTITIDGLTLSISSTIS